MSSPRPQRVGEVVFSEVDHARPQAHSWTMRWPKPPPLGAFVKKYGTAAIATYVAVYTVVFLSFAGAFLLGADQTSGGGILAAAWAATSLTGPLRTGACVVLVPLVAR